MPECIHISHRLPAGGQACYGAESAASASDPTPRLKDRVGLAQLFCFLSHHKQRNQSSQPTSTLLNDWVGVHWRALSSVVAREIDRKFEATKSFRALIGSHRKSAHSFFSCIMDPAFMEHGTLVLCYSP